MSGAAAALRAGELHHVGIAVPSIEEALPLYRDTLGLRAGEVREIPDQRVRVVFLEAAGDRVELVQSLDADSGVARFVASRGGPTLHHLCFAVDDLASALGELERQGIELIDRVPRPGSHGQVAFLHPRAAGGVLIELIDRQSLGDRG